MFLRASRLTCPLKRAHTLPIRSNRAAGAGWERQMTATIHGKTFEAKQTNGKFFYYSKAARRWMPVKAKYVQFEGLAING